MICKRYFDCKCDENYMQTVVHFTFSHEVKQSFNEIFLLKSEPALYNNQIRKFIQSSFKAI